LQVTCFSTIEAIWHVLERTRRSSDITFRALLQSELFDAVREMLNKKYISNVKLPENVILFLGKYQKTVSG